MRRQAAETLLCLQTLHPQQPGQDAAAEQAAPEAEIPPSVFAAAAPPPLRGVIAGENPAASTARLEADNAAVSPLAALVQDMFAQQQQRLQACFPLSWPLSPAETLRLFRGDHACCICLTHFALRL